MVESESFEFLVYATDGYLTRNVSTACPDPEWGLGVQTSLEKSRHYRPASKKPLKWRFAGGPIYSKSNKVAKIRNRYNQVQHLTQDTNGKPVLIGHSKINKTNVLKTNDSLMKVKNIAECSLNLVFFLSSCRFYCIYKFWQFYPSH